MSGARDFVSQATTEPTFEHPVLADLKNIPNEQVRVSIHRPKDILGYRSAKMYLKVLNQPTQEYAWDGDLDDALISKGIKATSPKDETMRFAMALRRSFKSIEIRYGEGFFNAVLVNEIKNVGLADEPPVAEVFREVRELQPFMNGRGPADCAEAINGALKYRANEISKLGYNVDETAAVFAGAVAQYLDERFSITDGKTLGWK